MLNAPEGHLATAARIFSVVSIFVLIHGCSPGLKTVGRFFIQLPEFLNPYCHHLFVRFP